MQRLRAGASRSVTPRLHVQPADIHEITDRRQEKRGDAREVRKSVVLTSIVSN
jgi:hypothetical protein